MPEHAAAMAARALACSARADAAALTPPCGCAAARPRRAAACHEPGRATQAARLAASDCGASVVARCSAASHLELVEVAPPFGALEELLASAAYGERHEARDGAGAAPPPGFTWCELAARVQCSDAQLRAGLARLHALELHGRWTTLQPGALRCAHAAPRGSNPHKSFSAQSLTPRACAARAARRVPARAAGRGGAHRGRARLVA